MDLIQTNALTGQDISGPLLVATYTADQDRELLVAVSLSGLSGGGTYLACLTHQIGGAGAFHQSPTGQFPLAVGVTTLRVQAGALAVGAGDVVRVYAQGLVADVNVEVTTEVFDVTATSTIAVSAATASTVATGTASITRNYTWSQGFTSTSSANLSAATKLWAVGKDKLTTSDDAAEFFIEKTAGLTRLAGAAYATTTNGSITVSGSSGAWSVTCKLEEAVTGSLRELTAAKFAIKALVAGDTVDVWSGNMNIVTGPIVAYS